MFFGSHGCSRRELRMKSRCKFADPQARWELARKYSPVLYLHAQDRYRPWDAQRYVEACALMYGKPGVHEEVLVPYPELGKSPSRLLGVMHRGECSSHAYPSNLYLNPSMADDPQELREGNLDEAKCYFRLRWVARPQRSWDLAYIFFYPYNGKLAGWGNHDGDFEHITVRLNPTATAVAAVYFSAHYFEGRWYRAVSANNPFGYSLQPVEDNSPTTHPVVYSAKHSHASYPTPGNKRRTVEMLADPRILDVLKDVIGNNAALPDDEIAPQSDDCIRLICRDRLEELPEVNEPSAPPWLRFSGRWGSDSGAGATVPHGPAYQPWWYDDDLCRLPYKHSIEFLAGNNSCSRVIFVTSDDPAQVLEAGGLRGFPRDNVRALRLLNVHRGTRVRLFDDRNSETSSDWTEIRVLRNVPYYFVPSLESTVNDGVIEQKHHGHSDLDGRISRVEIDHE